MSDDQPRDIPVFLCHDHFERLRRKDVCATCPSLAEHEAIVKAVAAQLENNPEFGAMSVRDTMIITQRLIRRALDKAHKT